MGSLPAHDGAGTHNSNTSTPNSSEATTEKQEPSQPQDPQESKLDRRPNGGLFAWTQVACSFFLYFNTYGIMSSFGIFQTYYETASGYTPAKASIIGSLQTFLIFFTTAIAGPLYDAGFCRHIVILGSLLVILGTMMQSLCTFYWQFILAQSLAIGIGGGLMAILGPTVLSTHFTTKYPLASGIGAAGGGIAGVIFPIVFRQLQPTIGFGWAVRVMGFITLATQLLPVVALRPLTKPASHRKAIDTTAFRDAPYLILLVGNFIMLLGVFTPFFYVQTFAISSRIASENLSFYILAIMNLTSAAGRIIPNFFSSKIGSFNMFLIMILISFIDSFAFIAVKTLTGLIIVAAVYGFSTGCVFALHPVVIIGLCPDPKMIGTRVGMAFSFLSFALPPSTPIAGALQERGGFNAVWVWTGMTTALGFFIMALARGLKTQWKWAAKV